MLGYAEQVLRAQQQNMTDKGKHILHYTLQKKHRHIFTVNRWVTHEIWYDAHYNLNFIKRFKMSLSDDPFWKKIDQWILGASR
jgi:hypothetical protein